MAKADWESEDFPPKAFQKPLLNSDRWEGEDEDDDVKDNWDDEEEEKEKSEQPVVAVQPKKKKSLAQTIAEKEEKKRKELVEKMKAAATEEEEEEELTPEELMAEKLRQQKLQEEADLELAKETFGVSETASSIDEMNPTTKDDFDNFRKELTNKISKYDVSPHYLLFLEELCRDLCLTLQPDDIKKVTGNLNALATEKLKAQKAAKAKKKSKKATLNVRKDDFTIVDYGDEYEDCI